MITCLGETLIDLMTNDSAGLTWRACPGGSPMNVAVGVGRLGAPVRFVGHLSTDRFGDLLRGHLDESGVDHSFCQTSDLPTTLAVVDSGSVDREPSFGFYAADTTAISFESPRPVPDDGIVHLSGSVSAVLDPAATAFADLIANHAAFLVTIDPNPRPSIVGSADQFRSHLDRWLPHAGLVKVSRADLEWLEPSTAPSAVAHRWLDRGVRAVVITRGGDGAVAYTTAGEVAVGSSKVEVLDTVGAGDSFMGALLTSLFEAGALTDDGLDDLHADQWAEMLRFACRVAALTCGRIGADPPWRSDL